MVDAGEPTSPGDPSTVPLCHHGAHTCDERGTMDEPIPDFFGHLPTLMLALSVVFFIIFLCVTAFIVFTWVKSYQVLERQGVDPLGVPAQIAGRLATSKLLAPEMSVEARLRDLEDLHTRGVISDEEYRGARDRVLADS